MTPTLRDAAQALYSACCNYGSQREQDIRDATKALGAALSAPQPAADERVAEHMKLVRLYGDESYGCTRKVADAYAVESSARALLAAGLEDAEMLNAIEAHTHTNWELSYTQEPEDDEPWEVYARTGPVNDQEWNLIAKGKTVREAIRAAMKGTP